MANNQVIINGHTYANEGTYMDRGGDHTDTAIDDDLKSIGWSRSALKTLITNMGWGDGSGCWPSCTRGEIDNVLQALGIPENTTRPTVGMPVILLGDKPRIGILERMDESNLPYLVRHIRPDDGLEVTDWFPSKQVGPLSTHPWTPTTPPFEVGDRVHVNGHGDGTIGLIDTSSIPYRVGLDTGNYWATADEITKLE